MFDKLKNAAEGLGVDLDHVNLQEVITDQFIKNHTVLESVQQFIEKSGFNISSVVDLKNVSPEKLDSFIKGVSNFGSWKDFLLKAAKEQVGEKLEGKLGGLGDKLGGFLNK